MNAAILGYGVSIPRYRIKTEDIAHAWGKDATHVIHSLGVQEKTVAASDEDAVTLAVTAALRALACSGVSPNDIGACFVGSESHPYAVNPTSTIVGEFIGIGRHYVAADLEFACKAATAGLIATIGLISSGEISAGLIIGSDKAQSKPHDVLEYTASSAAAAYVIGKPEKHAIAQFLSWTSFSSDTPDFWRRDGVPFPSHGGRFTGEPAYFAHVLGSTKAILQKTGFSPADFDFCIFHMPNGKFPRQIAKRLGFTDAQIAPSFLVPEMGNPYSASSLSGLAAVLDIAKPKQKVLLVSYGSGAGSDAFVLETREGILKRKSYPLVRTLLAEKTYISYEQYLRATGRI